MSHLAGRFPSHAARLTHIDAGVPRVQTSIAETSKQRKGMIGSRLYQFIRQQRPMVDRPFEIEFFEAGVEAFAFTFG